MMIVSEEKTFLNDLSDVMLKRAYKDHIKFGHCRIEWNLQSSTLESLHLPLLFIL